MQRPFKLVELGGPGQNILGFIRAPVHGQEARGLVQQPQRQPEEDGPRQRREDHQPAPVEVLQRGVVHVQQEGGVELPHGEHALAHAVHVAAVIAGAMLAAQGVPGGNPDAERDAYQEPQTCQRLEPVGRGRRAGEEENPEEGDQDRHPAAKIIPQRAGDQVTKQDPQKNDGYHGALLPHRHAPLLRNHGGNGAQDQDLCSIGEVGAASNGDALHLKHSKSHIIHHILHRAPGHRPRAAESPESARTSRAGHLSGHPAGGRRSRPAS
mmetsp:Transcript_48683/g.104315  ORF Transcript_48683/g.104315 Transcript_48683/m.104315 type:complete len:267 (-) Transcript_48683:2-802(-)